MELFETNSTEALNMLYSHSTENLLGLQGVNVTKVDNFEKNIIVYVELCQKDHQCPCCGQTTNTIHDYRAQKIKDVPAFGKLVTIILRKRRYRCNNCGKRFIEKNSFIGKYQRTTNRLFNYILDKLKSECSFSSVARETDLSVTTVIRMFDRISYLKTKLPEVLSIDEFKGNTQGEKYQCIITDPVNKIVLDILPERYAYYLSSYFKSYPKEERDKVKYFVSDMWKTYSDTSSVWFKNATQIVDKYHWIRQAIWAFERVRKEEQKKFDKKYRRYVKNSKRLLVKRFKKLTEEEKQRVNILLYASVNLSRAYFYKESFLNILESSNREEARKAMSDWIESAENCGVSHFESCAKTMINWSKGILNSFEVPYTNGFTEGCNNKIKVLKRNAYGYQNFKRFRNRILHMFSHQFLDKEQAAA